MHEESHALTRMQRLTCHGPHITDTHIHRFQSCVLTVLIMLPPSDPGYGSSEYEW